jgi:hypothetical protein
LEKIFPHGNNGQRTISYGIYKTITCKKEVILKLSRPAPEILARDITLNKHGKLLVEYVYDGPGNVVMRAQYGSNQTKPVNWRRYVYDQQGNLLQEAATTNKETPYSVRREYVWGPHGLILRETEQGQFFTLPDARGSVAALVDEQQQVVERYQYDPYGRVKYQNPDFTPREDTEFSWNLLWQSGYRDPLTGIYLGSDGAAYHERLELKLNLMCSSHKRSCLRQSGMPAIRRSSCS